MIAVDTNVLVYAHRADSPFHPQARDALKAFAESPIAWAIPWTCLHEFYAVVTHPRMYAPPSTPRQALKQIEAWAASPSLVLLSETTDHVAILQRLAVQARCTGSQIHDARIAANCLGHGVDEILTLDRDFARFPELRTRSLLS